MEKVSKIYKEEAVTAILKVTIIPSLSEILNCITTWAPRIGEWYALSFKDIWT